MGWIALAAVAIAAGLGAWLLGFPRALLSFLGSALMLGGAGYALQGRPEMPGRPVADRAEPRPVDSGTIALRTAMYGRFSETSGYFAISDAMLRAGKPRVAAEAMLAAIRAHPRDSGLWTGLGLALAQAEGNTLSPAARLAFEQGVKLAPGHPAPAFFYGMALVRGGSFAEARPWWARALRLTPPSVSYRGAIAERLALLDGFLAFQARIEARRGRGTPPLR